MGEILNEGGSAPLVHTTVSIQQSANQKHRNATAHQERHPIGQRRQKVPQGPNKTQQAQISRDDRLGIERREERLFPAEDHRQHRGKVQDQERFRGEEDPGMDDGEEDDQVLQRKVPPCDRKGEVVRSAGGQEAQERQAQGKQEDQEEV